MAGKQDFETDQSTLDVPIAISIVWKFQPGPIRFILVRNFWKEYSCLGDKETCSYALFEVRKQ